MMKLIKLTFILCTYALVFGAENVNKQPKAILIEAIEQDNIDEMYIDILESITEAFEYGASCQGKMQVLVAYLKLRDSTAHLKWVASEEPCGFYHNSDIYGYFEVTDSYGAKSNIKIIGYA
nr:uncharacterized protein LOC111427188 [Onthophagus taurus]